MGEHGLHAAKSMKNAQMPKQTQQGNRVVTEWVENGANNWKFGIYGYEPIGNIASSAETSISKINSLLGMSWNQHTPHIIDLALGRARIKLVEGGEECGRRFAQILARWWQAKLLSWKPYLFSSNQMVPYYIGCIASCVNADGSPATEGSSGGWPCPTDLMYKDLATPETQGFVRDFFKATADGPVGRKGPFDANKWRGKANEIPWNEFPMPIMNHPMPDNDGTGNPTQEITSDHLPPDPPGCFDTCPDHALVLRAFDHSSASASGGDISGRGTSGKGARRASISGGGAGMDVGISKLDLAQFATMPLGLIAEEFTLVLSAEQAGIRIPSGELPFDKKTGKPIESSFVADGMLSRLEESCQKYREIVSSRSQDAMVCLVVDAGKPGQRHPTGDEAVTLASTAVGRLQALVRLLVQQRRKDLGDVRRGFASVLQVLNRIQEVDAGAGGAVAASGAGSSERPPLVVKTSLERMAMQRTTVWDELLLGTLLSSRPEQDLFNQNPCMSAERARAAIECAHVLALKANRVSQVNQCIGLVQRLAGMLEGAIQSSTKSGKAVSP